MAPDALARLIVDEARSLGFARVGIVPVEPPRRHDVYRAWVDSGQAGEMGYLTSEVGVEARRSLHAVLSGARTVVVVALPYAAGVVPAGRLTGRIARYALGDDYHLVLKDKLKALGERVAAAAATGAGSAPPVAWRACVDTAPVLERDLAEAAGVGFVAKNTMLIAPGVGSYVLLGELLLDVEVAPAATVERKRCGDCRACLDACPTGAFTDAFGLDARRCISYLTIELQGVIPRDLRPLVGTWIFGCDVCQEVCPFNAAAATKPAAPELAPRLTSAPELLGLLLLNTSQYRRYVERTALRRVTRERFLRNVCVALGNAGDPEAIAPLRRAAVDERPLVRAHAVWALGRLGDGAWLGVRAPDEADPLVRAEFTAELALLTPSQ